MEAMDHPVMVFLVTRLYVFRKRLAKLLQQLAK